MNTLASEDGTTIVFDRYGAGPPLILVAGALADRAAEESMASALASYFTVFAYDRRGRGESGDTAPYAVEREIEDLDALIAEAGGSAHVFGHSSGAVLSLRSAANGLDISRLAVYEPPFIVDHSRPPLPEDYTEYLNQLIAEGRRSDAVAYFMTSAVGTPPEYVDEMRDSPMWESSVKMAHTIAYDGAIMGDTMSSRPLSSSPWDSISIPTFVIDGGASPEWMHISAQALTDVLPNGRRRTLEGQDHGPADDVLAPILVEFFAG